jgi:hypothetical protein
MTMVTDRQQAKEHVYGCRQALEQGAEEWQWLLIGSRPINGGGCRQKLEQGAEE